MKLSAAILGSVLALGISSFAQGSENLRAPPDQSNAAIVIDQNSQAFMMERWGWGRWNSRWGGWRGHWGGWRQSATCYWHPDFPRCQYWN